MGFAGLDSVEVARLEEHRQAVGTAEISDESLELCGGVLCFSGVGSWSNQGCGLGLDGPVADQEIDQLVDFYVSRGVQPQLEVCPFADDSLLAGLSQRGFVLKEFENVMALDTEAEGFDERLRAGPQLPDQVEFSWLDPADDDRVTEFIEVTGRGFHAQGERMSDNFVRVSQRMIQHARCDSFSATHDGLLVGGGSMECAGGISCLFAASVVPEFRRRGIQAELIRRRVDNARARGCRYVCIHSKPGIPTERNARRLGFQLAYSKVVVVMPGEGLVASP